MQNVKIKVASESLKEFKLRTEAHKQIEYIILGTYIAIQISVVVL